MTFVQGQAHFCLCVNRMKNKKLAADKLRHDTQRSWVMITPYDIQFSDFDCYEEGKELLLKKNQLNMPNPLVIKEALGVLKFLFVERSEVQTQVARGARVDILHAILAQSKMDCVTDLMKKPIKSVWVT